MLNPTRFAPFALTLVLAACASKSPAPVSGGSQSSVATVAAKLLPAQGD